MKAKLSEVPLWWWVWVGLKVAILVSLCFYPSLLKAELVTLNNGHATDTVQIRFIEDNSSGPTHEWFYLHAGQSYDIHLPASSYYVTIYNLTAGGDSSGTGFVVEADCHAVFQVRADSPFFYYYDNVANPSSGGGGAEPSLGVTMSQIMTTIAAGFSIVVVPLLIVYAVRALRKSITATRGMGLS